MPHRKVDNLVGGAPSVSEVSLADAYTVFQYDVGGVVLYQGFVSIKWRHPSINLVEFFCPIPQSLVLKMWVVGDGSEGGESDSRVELHGSREGGVGRSLCVDPVHEVDCVGVVELPQVFQLFGETGFVVFDDGGDDDHGEDGAEDFPDRPPLQQHVPKVVAGHSAGGKNADVWNPEAEHSLRCEPENSENNTLDEVKTE